MSAFESPVSWRKCFTGKIKADINFINDYDTHVIAGEQLVPATASQSRGSLYVLRFQLKARSMLTF